MLHNPLPVHGAAAAVEIVTPLTYRRLLHLLSPLLHGAVVVAVVERLWRLLQLRRCGRCLPCSTWQLRRLRRSSYGATPATTVVQAIIEVYKNKYPAAQFEFRCNTRQGEIGQGVLLELAARMSANFFCVLH